MNVDNGGEGDAVASGDPGVYVFQHFAHLSFYTQLRIRRLRSPEFAVRGSPFAEFTVGEPRTANLVHASHNVT